MVCVQFIITIYRCLFFSYLLQEGQFPANQTSSFPSQQNPSSNGKPTLAEPRPIANDSRSIANQTIQDPSGVDPRLQGAPNQRRPPRLIGSGGEGGRTQVESEDGGPKWDRNYAQLMDRYWRLKRGGASTERDNSLRRLLAVRLSNYSGGIVELEVGWLSIFCCLR